MNKKISPTDYKFIDFLTLRNMPIRNRLIILFSLFIVLSVFPVFLITNKIYTKTIEKQIYEFSIDTLRTRSMILDTNLKLYDKLSLQLFSNKEIRRILTLNENDAYKTMENSKKVRDIIRNLITDLNIEDLVGVVIHSFDDYYYMGDMNEEQIPYKNKYYEKIMSGAGQMVILDSEDFRFSSRTLKCFEVGRLINDEALREIGYLFITINSSFFQKTLKDTSFGPDSQFFVFSKNGELMYTNTQYGEYIEYLKKNMKDFRDPKKAYVESVLGNSLLITKCTSEYTGMTLVNMVPLDYLYRSTNTSRNITIIICLALLAIIIITAISISNDISKPISDLIGTIREITIGGNLSLRADVHKSLEMKELCRHFNTMVDSITKLMEESAEKQKKLVETELAVLQAQINPHFLHNTLNSIRWLAIINNQNQIKNIVDSLSNLLIHTFQTDRAYITFESELNILNSYINIMKIRYKTFDVVYNIDERTKSSRIPKFTLQPFVENSIIHGFQNIDYIGIIVISAKLDSNSLIIKIEDNGKGLPEDRKEDIMQLDFNEKSRFNSIGIVNVHKRIQLHFGPQYGIKIYDNPANGTIVEINLPE